MTDIRLNLGCGRDIREGWINGDRSNLPGVDIVLDISCIPLPFRDASVAEIVCDDLLEHIWQWDRAMKEFYRILKPGGKLTIRVPHFSSYAAFTDPTHVRFFGIRTFDFFLPGHTRAYYYDFSFSRMEKRRIVFDKSKYRVNVWIEHLANLNSRAQEFYEESFLRIFPALNIEIVLVK